MTHINLSRLTLVYEDPEGVCYTQPLSDITTTGTLIDPETGDDLELIAARLEPLPSDDGELQRLRAAVNAVQEVLDCVAEPHSGESVVFTSAIQQALDVARPAT